VFVLCAIAFAGAVRWMPLAAADSPKQNAGAVFEAWAHIEGAPGSGVERVDCRAMVD
jgi:hypothetical protein